MELKKRLDPKYIFIGLYVLAFLAYIIFGLQPADAANYTISAELNIPSIDLTSDVTSLKLEGDHLETPDTIVGSYSNSPHKTLLIGHSSTVFQNLSQIKLDDTVQYNNQTYRVISIDVVTKPHVNMGKILKAAPKDTIVIMTCAGQTINGTDATHRLIVTAITL